MFGLLINRIFSGFAARRAFKTAQVTVNINDNQISIAFFAFIFHNAVFFKYRVVNRAVK